MPDITDSSDENKIISTKKKEETVTPPSPITTNVQIKKNYPPLLWDKTQEIIKNIEEQLRSKVIVYYMNNASIDNQDVDYFLSHLQSISQNESISLILVSNGGSAMAAWRIASLIRNYCNTFQVIVPSRCASAATILSLSADKILISPSGYLTAIDTSLNHPLNPESPTTKTKPSISVDQINKVISFIEKDLVNHPNSNKTVSEILFEKIHPIVYGELERASSLSKMIAKNMFKLRRNPPEDNAIDYVVELLNDKFPAHGYPIVYNECQTIGLPVEKCSEELNKQLSKLLTFYSAISHKTYTHYSVGHWHLEHTPVAIESLNRRTFFSISYDNRNVNERLNLTENDKTNWLIVTNNPDDSSKPKISVLDL